MRAFTELEWVKRTVSMSKRFFHRIRGTEETMNAQAEILPETTADAAPTWREKLATAKTTIYTYKIQVFKGISVIVAIAAVSAAGNVYVKSNMNEIYQVSVNGTNIGTVSDPAIIAQFLQGKIEELKAQRTDVQVSVEAPVYEVQPKTVFNGRGDDTKVLSALASQLVAKPVGIELKIDGNVVAIVKDEETAKSILETIKQNYLAKEAERNAKKSGQVSVLSASVAPAPTVEQTELLSVGFAEQVELNQVELQPEQVPLDPQETVKKLETGDVQPTKYEVQEGDCISCIAKKFDISKQVIYVNNPQIKNDMVRVGDVLDLTVLQPTLSVKTEEKIVEMQEVQYPTEYIPDDDMRAGRTEVIKSGKNGMKRVTFKLTKENGLLMEEELVSEEMLQEPVTAVVKRGTKVVKGEGTGKFSWPVVSAKLSSGYGMRWGKLHKGIDLTSSNKNIIAADNGKVTYAGYKEDYGNMIIIDHLNGYETLYAHLSKITTKSGTIVEKGEKIGVMGNTGDSDGIHLHFEIHSNGSIQNPMKFLSR
ncbi:M23 family metallopeptidase [Paenibacillus turpanensis]|uniref:M23 family metallopeptidase n=1 Tax=Paenibacillus turpanensis TaxID=2689078 RepID=UPI00140B1962|nr:M23 family metallopeptidase [Paenibacillus turpanensis]